MNFSALLFKIIRWKVSITVPDYPKCIICVAPHTSNWDFVLGRYAYWSVGRKASFLMKKSWFFFPMSILLKAIGGIPVDRGPNHPSLTAQIIHKFQAVTRLSLAITPEGTRKPVDNWHTGFIHIAHEVQIPIVLGVIDYSRRTVFIRDTFITTGDTQRDLNAIKKYYRQFAHAARKPQNFLA